MTQTLQTAWLGGVGGGRGETVIGRRVEEVLSEEADRQTDTEGMGIARGEMGKCLKCSRKMSRRGGGGEGGRGGESSAFCLAKLLWPACFMGVELSPRWHQLRPKRRD